MDAAHRPLIAVTTSEMRSAAVDVPTAEADPPRREMALGMRYLEALERAGGLPVVVPPLGADAIEALLDRVDGVCLSGGPDIDPALYGAEPDPALGPIEPPLDAAELALARAADARAMPILGVCRGAQLLNVARGGTLHQHLPDAVAAALEHRQTAEATATTHHVDVQPGSRLAGVLGATRVDVNSFHHQAARDLGRGCSPSPGRPTGRSRPSRPPTGPSRSASSGTSSASPGARSTTPSSGPSSRPAAACRGGTSPRSR